MKNKKLEKMPGHLLLLIKIMSSSKHYDAATEFFQRLRNPIFGDNNGEMLREILKSQAIILNMLIEFSGKVSNLMAPVDDLVKQMARLQTDVANQLKNLASLQNHDDPRVAQAASQAAAMADQLEASANNAAQVSQQNAAPSITGISPTSGAPGSSAVIAGTGFGDQQNDSSVTFGGTAATATAWSDTSITVTVPATATTGTVNVVVGGVKSNDQTFTVSASNAPTVQAGTSQPGGPGSTA